MLTERIAKQAVEMALPAILTAMDSRILKRKQLHIVVGTRYKPHLVEDRDQPDYFPEVLYRHDVGSRTLWEGPYETIAWGKAALTWRTGLPTRVVQLQYPHLLRPGDTRHWGSWIEAGILTAASGVQSWGDEWASRLVVSSAIALCCRERLSMEDIMRSDDYRLPPF